MKIKVAKTQITFANKRGFAFVSFNPCRRAKDRPAVWLTVTFGLGYRKESPRIDVATEAYPGRWTHHVMVKTKKSLSQMSRPPVFITKTGGLGPSGETRTRGILDPKSGQNLFLVCLLFLGGFSQI